MTAAAALVAHEPALLALRRVPWVALGTFPTPVERVPALGDVWVKRDDLSGDLYGGNKVRKLEWLLGDAQARGKRALLTLGGTGSNHVLATALYARRLGFAATHAVLFPQPHTDDVARKLEAYERAGVRRSRVWGKPFIPLGVAVRVAAALRAGEGMPYFIGPGGSSPTGTLGYVNAALELAAQVGAGVLPAPDRIYVPLGSGGTVAGLVVGLRLAGLASRVVAVQVVPWPWATAGVVVSLANKTARLVGGPRVDARDFDVVGDALGPGYGAPTPAAIEACARAADAGLRAETTYSGKTLAALLARQGQDRGLRVLWWLTYSSVDG